MRSILFADNLFLGHLAMRREKKIRRKLNENSGMLDTFLIVLPRHGNDLLEIVHSSVLMQPYFDYYPPLIVGIAIGKYEAMLLLQEIVRRVLCDTGGYDYKSYFKFRDERSMESISHGNRPLGEDKI